MKILVVSNDGVPDGYGRISMEVNKRLTARGHQVMAASLRYDGLLPPQYEGEALPYWVASLDGHADWVGRVNGIAASFQPDVVLVVQDAPYAEAVLHGGMDWSMTALVIVTPVDGAPVHPRWLEMLKQADASMSISEFGVNAHREGDVNSALLRPGVDTGKLYPLEPGERAQLRLALGIGQDAFVLATMAQNQGRKCYPDMLRGFFEFAKGRDAYYLLDTEATSPAGWDIPAMCEQFGWDRSKLRFREDAQRAGLTELRQRYGIADVHTVIAHREGWGLPLVEAMACGVASMALDWCSGTEICGEGRGVLVKPDSRWSVSTWGNAIDKHMDIDDFVQQLTVLADEPEERHTIARRGMVWARTVPTWDAAADAVEGVLKRVQTERAKIPSPQHMPRQTPPPTTRADGMKVDEMPLLEVGL